MASPAKKRKAHESRSNRSSNKKAKHASSSEGTSDNSQVTRVESEVEEREGSASDQYWKVKDIIGERSNQYRIDWDGLDPQTGKKYKPTWEPKFYVTKAAIAAWEKRKQEKTVSSRRATGQSSSPALGTTHSTPVRPSRRSSRRLKLVIGSPFETTDRAQENGAGDPSLVGAHLEEEEIEDSFEKEKGIDPISQQLLVEIDQHSSFDRDQYISYSSALSAPVPTSSRREGLHEQQKQILQQERQEASVPVVFDHEGIVPDSQSLPGSSSFLPSASKSNSNSTYELPNSSSREIITNTNEETPSILRESSPLSLNNDSGFIQHLSSPAIPEEHTNGDIRHSNSGRSVTPNPPTPSTGSPHSLACQPGLAVDRNFRSPTTPVEKGVQEVIAAEADTESRDNLLAASTSLPSPGIKGVDAAEQPQIAGSPSVENNPQSTLTYEFLQKPSVSSAIPEHQVSSLFQPSAEGLSGLLVARQDFGAKSAQSDHADSLNDHNQSSPNLASEGLTDYNVEFQTQIAFSHSTSTEGSGIGDNVSQGLRTSASPIPRRDFTENRLFEPVLESGDSSGVSQNTSASGEVWQAGQIVPQSIEGTSQKSSSGQDINKTAITHQRDFQAYSAAASHRVRSVTPKHFAVSQDQGQDRQESTTTESSALTQRDPNPIRNPSQPQFASPFKEIEYFQLSRVVDNVLQSLEQDIDQTNIDLQETSTSAIPPPPSQLLGTFMSSVSRSQTTSEDDMSEVPPPLASPGGSTLREKLRKMRASSAARRADASRSVRSTQSPSLVADIPVSRGVSEATKSPSVIPADTPIQPLQAETVMKVPLPLRVPQTVDPHAPSKPSHLSLHKEMSQQVADSITSLGVPRLSTNEFIVSLPMDLRVRDQYEQTVFNYRDNIEVFTGSDHPNPVLLRRMADMVHHINNITTHLDLDNEGTLTQAEVPIENEARWAEACSAKFEFLRHLFDLTRSHEKHIAILAQAGRMMDILETFLIANHIVYFRPDNLRRSDFSARGPLNVTLLSTCAAGSGVIVNSAALVVAFDGSCNIQERQVQSLRAHMFNVGQLSPVVCLIVVNSAEHIERCLPANLDGTRRLQALVSYIAQTRHAVGALPLEAPNPATSAEGVARFISLDESGGQWTLPPIGEILGVTPFTDSIQSGNSTESTIQDEKVLDRERQAFSASLKRPFTDDNKDNVITPKKLRLTPVSDELLQPVSTEITHKSMDNSETTPQLAKDPTVDPPSPIVRNTRGSPLGLAQGESKQQHLPNERIRREDLHDRALVEAEQRLQEHVEALSQLQFRYEDRNREVEILCKERDSAIAAVAQVERRGEMQAMDIVKLKENYLRLETELREVRSQLESLSIPEISQFERLRADLKQTLADKERLEHRIESLTTDFEFTRLQYQQASSHAVENANEATSLREENKALTKKASGEAVRLRQLNQADEMKVHLARIEELELGMAERDDLLRKKEEELKVQTRGRGLATRASSVPRSPKPYSRASSPNSGSSVARAHPLRFS